MSAFLLAGVLSTVLIGQVVHASTGSYKERLPTMGTRYSREGIKETNSTNAFNQSDYFGWAGSGVNCWIERASDGMDLTVTAWYTGTGRKYFGYLTPSAASDNVGKAVRLALKTDQSTWHECDVEGYMQPDN